MARWPDAAVGPADMGEDFDFGDDRKMRTRLPRPFALRRVVMVAV